MFCLVAWSQKIHRAFSQLFPANCNRDVPGSNKDHPSPGSQSQRYQCNQCGASYRPSWPLFSSVIEQTEARTHSVGSVGLGLGFGLVDLSDENWKNSVPGERTQCSEAKLANGPNCCRLQVTCPWVREKVVWFAQSLANIVRSCEMAISPSPTRCPPTFSIRRPGVVLRRSLSNCGKHRMLLEADDAAAEM